MDIRNDLASHVLLFDGAMGTMLPETNGPCELCCLNNPDAVAAIHRAYLDSGCRALKTNSFAANRPALGEMCGAVLDAAYAIAAEAAAGRAYVFADIGPIPPEAGSAAAEFQFLADRFLSLGAEHFLFETLSTDIGIAETAAHIKLQKPDAFILVSFAAQPDGFTRAGLSAGSLLRRCAADPNIDAVGLGCAAGAGHMGALLDAVGPLPVPLSVMPTAGYPTVLGRRVYYQGKPEYFGQQLAALREKGAQILGGCCGTTPAHIAAAAEALKKPAPKTVPKTKAEPAPRAVPENRFWDALCDPNRMPAAVELDPPEAADVTKFMAGAVELQKSGAAVLTIADCPIARARMDASLLACKVRRELGMEVLPHMTCRDRNLNATKALLLGLCAEDVHNVLAVTGDPIPSASRDEVKSVYNFNSRMLANYIRSLNESLPVPFHVFGALNVNARNFRIQLSLAKEKEENGVCGFLTQPVLTEAGLQNLKLARQELHGKILGGIIPIVSYRNAVYMNSEVSGIDVDPEIIRRYEGLDRAQGEDLAVKISTAAAEAIAPYADGFYLMTPFGRTGLIARILDVFRAESLL